MDTNSAKFIGAERLYNSTVKQAFKIPQRGSKESVNSFLGSFNMQNIVLKSYGSNAIKWQKTYRHDYGDKKYDIGFEMNIKLKAIQQHLNVKRSDITNSDRFQQ